MARDTSDKVPLIYIYNSEDSGLVSTIDKEFLQVDERKSPNKNGPGILGNNSQNSNPIDNFF